MLICEAFLLMHCQAAEAKVNEHQLASTIVTDKDEILSVDVSMKNAAGVDTAQGVMGLAPHGRADLSLLRRMPWQKLCGHDEQQPANSPATCC